AARALGDGARHMDQVRLSIDESGLEGTIGARPRRCAGRRAGGRCDVRSGGRLSPADVHFDRRVMSKLDDASRGAGRPPAIDVRLREFRAGTPRAPRRGSSGKVRSADANDLLGRGAPARGPRSNHPATSFIAMTFRQSIAGTAGPDPFAVRHGGESWHRRCAPRADAGGGPKVRRPLDLMAKINTQTCRRAGPPAGAGGRAGDYDRRAAGTDEEVEERTGSGDRTIGRTEGSTHWFGQVRLT